MTVALTVGCFDLLHHGHLNLFAQMKTRAEMSVVVVHDDSSIEQNKGRRPVQPVGERVDALEKCDLVDAVFTVHDADPSHLLRQMLSSPGPWVYVRGDDWPDFPGREAVEAAGVPVQLVPYTPGVSTTMLREAM